jgi:hypothetical protein
MVIDKSIKYLRIPLWCAIITTISSSQLCAKVQHEKILSPDKQMIAIITSTGSWNDSNSESKIEVRTAKGKLIWSASYYSADHSHGERIYKAQWTPDSKFLVFNSVSSGGHQPGHLLTRFWRRAEDKIHVLDRYLGIWVVSDFKLKPPDSIGVVVSHMLPNGKIADTTRTVPLSGLVR